MVTDRDCQYTNSSVYHRLVYNTCLHCNTVSLAAEGEGASLTPLRQRACTMLAMERLPPSQSHFHGSLPLNSPTMQSPRAGMPAPAFIQGLPSPPSLQSNVVSRHQLPHPSHIVIPKVRIGSSSSLSSVQTPPPYDTGLMGSTATVYSPTGVQTSPLLPQSSAEHDHCHTEPNPIISPTALSGPPGNNVVMSTAGSTTPGGSGVNATREHQSSSPTGERLEHAPCMHACTV